VFAFSQIARFMDSGEPSDNLGAVSTGAYPFHFRTGLRLDDLLGDFDRAHLRHTGGHFVLAQNGTSLETERLAAVNRRQRWAAVVMLGGVRLPCGRRVV